MRTPVLRNKRPEEPVGHATQVTVVRQARLDELEFWFLELPGLIHGLRADDWLRWFLLLHEVPSPVCNTKTRRRVRS